MAWVHSPRQEGTVGVARRRPGQVIPCRACESRSRPLSDHIIVWIYELAQTWVDDPDIEWFKPKKLRGRGDDLRTSGTREGENQSGGVCRGVCERPGRGVGASPSRGSDAGPSRGRGNGGSAPPGSRRGTPFGAPRHHQGRRRKAGGHGGRGGQRDLRRVRRRGAARRPATSELRVLPTRMRVFPTRTRA